MSRFFRQAGYSDSESEESEEELLTSGDEDNGPPKHIPTTTKPAMSRFLRKAGSSSSSSSSSDNEGEDEGDSDVSNAAAKKNKSRFLHSDSEVSDSEDEVKRPMRSARDKRLFQMEATGKVMDNALKINDWVAISNGVWSSVTIHAHSQWDDRVRQTSPYDSTTT